MRGGAVNPFLWSRMHTVCSLEAASVTHHSVELTWRAPLHGHEAGSHRPLYTVQEMEAGKGRGFANIYRLEQLSCVQD